MFLHPFQQPSSSAPRLARVEHTSELRQPHIHTNLTFTPSTQLANELIAASKSATASSDDTVAPHLLQRVGTAWRLRPVPRIVHQIWADGEALLPPRLARWRRRCERLSPGWSLRVWSIAKLRALVDSLFPAFSHTFNGYQQDIKRIDAA